MYLIFCTMIFSVLLYTSFLLKNKSLTMSIGLCLFVELIWALLSIAYLDTGNVYIYETGNTSFHTGALFRMVLLFSPLIVLISNKNSGKISEVYKQHVFFKKKNIDQCIHYILIFSLLVILYCIVDMFISGIPLFSSKIGRINYSTFSKLPFATKINGEVTFYGVIIAGIANYMRDNKKNKYLAKIVFTMTIFHRILMEYKYQGLYNIIYSFFLPYILIFLDKKNYHVFSIKTALKVSLIGLSLVFLCLFTYSNVNKNFDAKELLFNRIFALQSHTFWEMDKIMCIDQNNLSGNDEDLNNELNAVYNNLGELDKNSGIINVMYKVSNPTTVNANLENGVRWSGNYVTVGINTIGYYGTFFMSFILGMILLFDFKMFYVSINNFEFISLYLSQSFMWDLLDFFRIGNWSIILNFKTIIVFLGLVFIYINKRKIYKNKKRIVYYG